MRISGCIIAKNEEGSIGRCIESLKNVCDEIILVDTGSKDSTVEIATSLGVNVYYFKWVDDFSKAKNFAKEKATGDWIIFLDADEYLPKLNRDVLVNLASKPGNFDSVLCEIINIDENSNASQSHIGNRFFRNLKSIKFIGKIHEDLRKDNHYLTSINGYNELKIIHTGYSPTIIKEKNKFERNIKILLKELEERPNDPELYYYIADTYGLNNDYDKQIEYCKKSIVLGRVKQLGFEELPYILLIKTMIDSSKSYYEIKFEINNAIENFPTNPVFYYFSGLLELKNKKYNLAMENFIISLNLNFEYRNYSVDYMKRYLKDIYYFLGQIASKKLDLRNAMEFYLKAIELDREDKDVFIDLMRLLANEAIEDKIIFINSIYNLTSKDELNFLIQAISSLNEGTLLSYYIKKYEQITGEGNNAILLNYLMIREFSKAFEYSHKFYLETYRYDIGIVASISSLYSGNENFIKTLLPVVQPSVNRLISIVRGNTVELMDEDYIVYLDFLRRIIQFGKGNEIKDFLTHLGNFKGKFLLETAEFLMHYKEWKYAESIYAEEINRVGLFVDNKVYKNLGICLYMLGEFEKATEHFIMSFTLGNLEYETFEYMYFTYFHVSEEKRKNILRCLKLAPNETYIYELLKGDD
ncbi:glycosyltransferase [Robertmurraya beringensis]|uniref:Glycosyltransferase n=1 Tax=Robertmurraya beringensis TaxID=641660 RepID=A0ABV6L0K3_9BACI